MHHTKLGQAHVYIIEQPTAFEGLLSSFPHYRAESLRRFASAGRRREWLSVRQLLHSVLGPGVRIVYASDGSPRLEGSALHISIAHSGPYAALALSQAPTGLDIEQAAAKAARLQPRFSTPEELLHLPATEIWCAKEAAYKLLPLAPGTPLTAVRILGPRRAACQGHEARLRFARHGRLHICVAEEA